MYCNGGVCRLRVSGRFGERAPLGVRDLLRRPVVDVLSVVLWHEWSRGACRAADACPWTRVTTRVCLSGINR